MNEEQKNIETCLPENILAEVASVPTDPQFRSLVEESFDPLQQQAVQQAGSDAYNEVVASHQPYTFTSQVRQMKSNLILLLRRFWRFPFGTGTLRSLSDMWQHYITRLQGSETYGIPSRLDQLTDLPSAPLLVADRKISNGGAENDGIADGVSLVHLLCDNAATKLVDDNRDWAYSVANKAASIFSLFASADDVTFGFGSCTADFLTSSANATKMRFPALKTISCTNFIGTGGNPGSPSASWATTHLYFDSLELASNLVRYYGNGWWNEGMMNLQYIYLPKLKRIYSTGTAAALFQGKCPSLTKLEMPELETMDLPLYGGETLSGLTELRMPKLKYMNVALCSGTYPSANGLPNLLLLEVGPVETNVNLAYWSPTLDSSNLQQFLQNFRDYIALRLTDNGSGKTLTLSQAVRNAIHAAEATYGIENIIITQKGWTISPAPN